MPLNGPAVAIAVVHKLSVPKPEPVHVVEFETGSERVNRKALKEAQEAWRIKGIVEPKTMDEHYRLISLEARAMAQGVPIPDLAATVNHAFASGEGVGRPGF